jgi:hypothetical protein
VFPEVACAAAVIFITVIAPGIASSSIPISAHPLGFQCIIVLLVSIHSRSHNRNVSFTPDSPSARAIIEKFRFA